MKRTSIFALILVLLITLPLPGILQAQGEPERQVAFSGMTTPISLRHPTGTPPYTPHIDRLPDHGTLETGSETVVLYTADEGYVGPDSFVYTLTDATGVGHTATVELTVVMPLHAGIPAGGFEAGPPGGFPSAVTGQYILHYRPGTPYADVEARVRAAGGVVIDHSPQLHAVVVSLATTSGRYMLSNQAETVALEPNLIRYPMVSPNDPDLGDQWGLNNIHAYDAWDITLGTGQQIAVLDEGIDLNHPDLSGHLLSGYDFVDDDTNPSPVRPDETHGTHVTGIANARTDNLVGVAGVAWDARTMPVRIIGEFGATSWDIANGIVYATDQGAEVINMSLGGPGWIQMERDAVNYAAARDVVVFAAAGNEGNTVVYYPASYDHVISVASTTSLNQRSSFSNMGSYVDIAAPGSNIYSTLYDNTYGYLSGTSMATPHAAGAAALVWSAGQATTAAEVTEALLCSAFDLGTSGRDDSFGWGLLQADAAVAYTPASSSCVPTVDHDDFDTPRTFNGSFYTDTVDTSHATSWDDDPIPCAGDYSRSVWYRYDPPAFGSLTITTEGSTYDTVLSVWQGNRGSLTQLACNDNTVGLTSLVMLDVAEGNSIYVMVSSLGFEGYEGTLSLEASLAAVTPSECIISATGTVICSTR